MSAAKERPNFQAPEELTFFDDIEVSKMISVSKSQLKIWRTQTPPTGPKVTYFGRLARYSLADLRAYVASRPTSGGTASC